MECSKKRGKLYLIIGPMFSGKTSELIRRMKRYKICNFKCLVVRYAKDNRYSSVNIASHDGKEMPAVGALELKEIKDFATDCDIIGIDEVQFFPDLVEFCDEQLQNGKTIIAAGLDATFKRTGFEQVLNLIPLAHNIDKLSAICMSCGNSASFSKRVGSETEVVVIGGLEKYLAVCRECYKLTNPTKRSPFQAIEDGNYKLFTECDLNQFLQSKSEESTIK